MEWAETPLLRRRWFESNNTLAGEPGPRIFLGDSMKVLVTGSAGFVGSHLVDYLLSETNWEIVGLDSFKHKGDPKRISGNSRYQIACCDLAAPISMRLIQQIGSADVIVNMASLSHVETSIQDPVNFVQNNVSLALNTLELARLTKPKTFIQISTDEVYGPAPEGTSYSEWSPIVPSNPYAASKAAQEAIAISYWRTYGVPLVIVNGMNMFGERQDKEKFIPLCISKILKGEKVYIHGTTSYIGKRSYLHAKTFSDALLFLMRYHEPKAYEDSVTERVLPDRFNISGDLELNNLEVASMISNILKKELSFELVDFHRARPGHDRRYALDGSKLHDRGWQAPTKFHESLSQTVKWTADRPEWL
jgi:dTDP-glucose 4,6-dehydratase